MVLRVIAGIVALFLSMMVSQGMQNHVIGVVPMMILVFFIISLARYTIKGYFFKPEDK